MSDPHVADHDAAGLASLAPDDPERVRAFDHARACPDCAAKLRAGERLMDTLALLPAPDAPSELALQRAAAAIRADLAAPMPAWLPPAAVGASWLAFAAGYSRLSDARAWAPAVALGAVAVTLAALAPRLRALASAATVLVAGGFAAFAFDRAAPEHGVHYGCALIELAAGALPLGAVVYGGLRRKLRATPSTYAAVCAAGSLAGMAVMHVGCPDRSLGHLSVFHVGSVLAAALLGAAVGRWPALRSEVA